jgi:hypothetical protein
MADWKYVCNFCSGTPSLSEQITNNYPVKIFRSMQEDLAVRLARQRYLFRHLEPEDAELSPGSLLCTTAGIHLFHIFVIICITL